MIDSKQKNSLGSSGSNRGSIVSYLHIVDLIVNKPRNKDAKAVESYVPCPICGKEIDYYWSDFAGVERARCRTPGCFNFNKALVPKKKPKLKLRKQAIKLTPKKKPKLVLRKKTKQLTLF